MTRHRPGFLPFQPDVKVALLVVWLNTADQFPSYIWASTIYPFAPSTGCYWNVTDRGMSDNSAPSVGSRGIGVSRAPDGDPGTGVAVGVSEGAAMGVDVGAPVGISIGVSVGIETGA